MEDLELGKIVEILIGSSVYPVGRAESAERADDGRFRKLKKCSARCRRIGGSRGIGSIVAVGDGAVGKISDNRTEVRVYSGNFACIIAGGNGTCSLISDDTADVRSAVDVTRVVAVLYVEVV